MSAPPSAPAPPPGGFHFSGPVTGAVFNLGPQHGVVSTGDHANIQQTTTAPASSTPAPALAAADRAGLLAWAGAERLTLAIVFTDLVDSTALGARLGDETWTALRRAHFARAETLLARHGARLVKNLGDGLLVIARDAAAGFDFARELLADPGEARLRLRAGLHLGELSIQDDDTFGLAVNYAARVMAHAVDGGLRLSPPARAALLARGRAQDAGLRWTEHPEVILKGIPDACSLWSVN